MRKTIPHNPSPVEEKEIDALPIIALAFVGDAVQTLYERTLLVGAGCAKTNVLHKEVSKLVNANRQAEALKEILPKLTEREEDIFRRARNVSPHNVPKHSDQNSYRAASGYEAVVGYLYLTGQDERLSILLNDAYLR